MYVQFTFLSPELYSPVPNNRGGGGGPKKGGGWQGNQINKNGGLK